VPNNNFFLLLVLPVCLIFFPFFFSFCLLLSSILLALLFFLIRLHFTFPILHLSLRTNYRLEPFPTAISICQFCQYPLFTVNKRRSSVVGTPASYSASFGFKCLPRYQLPWLWSCILVFLCLTRQMPGEVPKLVHNNFLHRHIHFIIYYSFYLSTQCNLSYWWRYYRKRK
jgi:hypothetical protein